MNLNSRPGVNHDVGKVAFLRHRKVLSESEQTQTFNIRQDLNTPTYVVLGTQDKFKSTQITLMDAPQHGQDHIHWRTAGEAIFCYQPDYRNEDSSR